VVERFAGGGEEFALLSWPVARAATTDLPAAQAEVLARILDGLSNAEIAAERGTSPRTVANQVAQLLRHFGVGSRIELASAVSRKSR
jgi:DNA-binding NarL/FixJ family response regulator